MIELRHLKKTYENAEPLKDVSVTVHDGDVIAVIGPSGTGSLMEKKVCQTGP